MEAAALLRHPAVVGGWLGDDTLFLCLAGPVEAPRRVTVRGRLYRTAILATGRFAAMHGGRAPPRGRYHLRHRPLQAGWGLGTRRSVGTLGLVVVPATGPPRCAALTAGHVVAGSARRGGAVMQPAGPDGGRWRRDAIGAVAGIALPAHAAVNRIDAAVIALEPGLELDLAYPEIGPLRGHAVNLREGWTLHKIARTTGAVEGRIVSTRWSGIVDYPFGRRRFDGQVLIHGGGKAMTLAGDSGAVWVTPSGHAAALSFSAVDATGEHAIATPIAAVLDTFGLRVAVAAAGG